MVPLLVAAGLGQVRAADQRVRVLRPLLRRDLALGHAAGMSGGSATPPAARARGQVAESSPVPAVLLGPAALVAAAGSVLRRAALTVAGRGGGEPALRQWQPVLAAAFADLLACESLTCVALRRPAGPGPAPARGRGRGCWARWPAMWCRPCWPTYWRSWDWFLPNAATDPPAPGAGCLRN
ncbi:hypothetical protein HEP84_52750 [Streptomyces sp. RLB1-33]|nr:hypothetical protein [Streptomyces sp. RLB1-33]QIY76265.1 hypothetical protein HEP84_52750 [Streptomyces sp. RLB1-33]